ncbi:hypothetical protein [Hydrogenophaga sp.]|uniref:hypothetical protein n=1 Tax=Hydrogenophaga sp. TaxID=1904254 RepID=UPI003F6EC6AC
MKVDEICERNSEKRTDLTIHLLDDEDGDPPSSVLIEGPVRALRMLAELLTAVADEAETDGFPISPFSAGKAHFSAVSQLGVYIHRLP